VIQLVSLSFYLKQYFDHNPMIDNIIKVDGSLDHPNQTNVIILQQNPPNDLEQTSNEQSMNHTPTTTTTTMPSSLAYTTSRWITLSITLSILVTHGLFLYGQIQPMWKLTHYESIDIWWNATTTTSQWAFHTLGLPHDVHFQIKSTNSSVSSSPPQSNISFFQEDDTTTTSNTIQTFTYAFAIQELWEAKGMSAGIFVSRIAAILLTVFSGIWPHVKLLPLQIMWWVPVS
jgi:hypothetical protein